MTVTVKVLVPAKTAEAAQTTQYTVPAATKAIIDKFTATNYSAGSAVLSVNLVTATDTSGSGNLIVSAKTLAPNEAYTFPELVGHVLEAGGSISTLRTGAGSLNIRVSGREVT